MRPGMDIQGVRNIFGLLHHAAHHAFRGIEQPSSDDANECESALDSLEQQLMSLLRVAEGERIQFVKEWVDQESR